MEPPKPGLAVEPMAGNGTRPPANQPKSQAELLKMGIARWPIVRLELWPRIVYTCHCIHRTEDLRREASGGGSADHRQQARGPVDR